MGRLKIQSGFTKRHQSGEKEFIERVRDKNGDVHEK